MARFTCKQSLFTYTYYLSLMKKAIHSLLLLLILFSLAPQALGQFYFFTTGPNQTRPCPWDSTVSMFTSTNWDAYQTLNDHWDGPIDSSRCIPITTARLNLADIDPAKPVFIRYRIPNPNSFPLNPNKLYINNYNPPSLSGNSTFLLADSTCPDQQCTSLHLGIQIPDSFGTGTDTRWYRGNFSRDPFIQQTGFCFPSEKFSTQSIAVLYFRFQFDQYDPNSTLKIPALDISEHFLFTSVNRFTANFTPGSSPAIQIFNQVLMLHDDSTYPGPKNPFYIDVGIQPKSGQQERIFIYIEPFAYLTGQPFTELRGDTVLGGNGSRHQVILINRGGTLCFAFLELVFRQGNGFRHERGKLTFQHPSGCMAFHSGSYLEVAAGEDFTYGQDGLGVLLLREGMEIRLEQHASVTIANRLVLDAISQDGNVHIYLAPGRKLAFEKSAKILVGGKSANPDAKLVVHLRGGELDISKLATSSKQRITILEEGKLSQLFEDAAILYDKGEPFVSFYANEDMLLELSVHDIHGRLVWEKDFQLNQGKQLLSIPKEQLHAGVYVIRLANGNKVRGLSYLR